MRKINRRKCIVVALGVMCIAGIMAGCRKKASTDNNSGAAADNFAKQEISVVTREEGSGTRGAFIELFGIEEKDANGVKTDKTTDEAINSNSTEVMMQTVSGNKAAIGYTSLGALKDTVKALKVDGAEATVENVKNGTYKVSRPFNIATKGDLSDTAQDFVNYIMSAEGQKVIEDKGYISEGNSGAFKSNQSTGKVTISGSSSVTPVMEKLADAYKKINSGVTIEINQSDSSSGITSAAEGKCDIGMSSRDLKDTELAKGLTSTKIAIDGIAVIVNRENSLDNITTNQVKAIYTGETTIWGDVK